MDLRSFHLAAVAGISHGLCMGILGHPTDILGIPHLGLDEAVAGKSKEVYSDQGVLIPQGLVVIASPEGPMIGQQAYATRRRSGD